MVFAARRSSRDAEAVGDPLLLPPRTAQGHHCGQGSVTRSANVLAEWPLVGRTAQLAQLRKCLTAVPPRATVIAGPAGVGKSRLALEGLRLAEKAGFSVARATGTRSSATIPLGVLAPLLPVAPRCEQGRVDERADLLSRCRRTLMEWGEQAPVVLLVDDAHLLDDLSATLIHQLVEAGGLRVIVTMRSCEVAPDPIMAVWKDGLADRIELSGVPADAIGEALSWVLGGPVDEATVADLSARSGGNMLFLREIVLGAVESGVLSANEGVWQLVGDLRPPDRLIELVEARVAGLTGAERELLEVVSFGEPVGPAELDALADTVTAEALERKGLLVSRADGRRILVHLAHPIYGEVLRARVPALRARSIARSLAEAVEGTGGRRREDTLRVATWRLAGGGAEPDLMFEAALTARWRYDFVLAERLARSAVDAGAGFPARLLVAELAGLQGRSADAAAALAGLAATAETHERQGRVALARLDNRVIYAGTIAEGMDIAADAERSLAGTAWKDMISARRAALVLATEGPRRAVEVTAPLLATATGEALVWACMPGSYSLGRMGRIDAALDAARRGRSEQLQLSTPMDWYPWMHLFYEAEALSHAGRLHEAEAFSLAQYRAGVDSRSVEEQAMFSWQLAKTVADRGHVDDSLRRLHTAMAIFRRLGRPQFVEFCCVYVAIAAAVGRRSQDAFVALAARDDLGIGPGFFMGVDLLQAEGWALVAAGKTRAGVARLTEAADAGERIGDLVGAAAALHTIARVGQAKTVWRRLGDLVADMQGELPSARAEHAAALSAADGSRLDGVSVQFEAMGATLLAAEAAADAAVAWRRSGNPRLAAAGDRRAGWLAACCVGSATPALQVSGSRACLTPAEWETAQLASAGESNRRIAEELAVSVRTVENRLQQIYGKLGVGGRHELGGALATVSGSASPRPTRSLD